MQRTASSSQDVLPPGFGYGGGANRIRRPASTGATPTRRSRKAVGLQPFSAEEQMKSEVYGPHNLARRPLDWRRDFTTLAEKFAAKLPGYKIRSEVKEFNDPITRTAHELLAYKNRQEPIFVDLRFAPQRTLDFPLLNRRYNQVDFDQLATQPAAQDMRLYHDSLPWYIDIVQRCPNGITVFDVIRELYTQLSVPIQDRHWYNDTLTPVHHEKMSREWEARVQRQAEGYNGVRRVDFLHGKTIFLGLKRGPRGLWEIKTARWDKVEGYFEE
ncbi:hypothetical protein DXG03_009517 [Asterophora parasitica]|uniref:DUF6699 domain-containing protein n=1 Tax=Asterophora parasitica TaxID=117018 RepID=A0A9P7GB99_9AGAR|nr:hypothetical protein DXG03_009517 [Asterophora parasitica]